MRGRPGVARRAGPRVPTRATPRVQNSHYPPAPPGALGRRPKVRTTAEAQFLAIGEGAGLWVGAADAPRRHPGGGEAAAAGATRVRAKMAQATQLAALHGAAAVARALGQAAAAGRFADRDLASILA